MTSEIESIDQYLTGQVYGFRVLDPDGEEVDARMLGLLRREQLLPG